jgi:hypothetical protein
VPSHLESQEALERPVQVTESYTATVLSLDKSVPYTTQLSRIILYLAILRARRAAGCREFRLVGGQLGRARGGGTVTERRRSVGPTQLFSLGFGTMLRAGWVLALGQWLVQWGPHGTALGVLGGAAAIA